MSRQYFDEMEQRFWTGEEPRWWTDRLTLGEAIQLIVSGRISYRALRDLLEVFPELSHIYNNRNPTPTP